MDFVLPTTLLFWHWWILGGLLLVLELVAPGVFFLWVGLAAGATGLIVLIVPGMAWEWQALLFALLALGATFAGRRIWRPGAAPTDHPLLNRRAQRHVGRVVTLTAPLRDGRARVHVGDSEWSAVADDVTLDLPEGTSVRVVDVRDGNLLVAPLDSATAGGADPGASRHSDAAS
jgi:membrane protein implicated in regulation of membrane protease activity